MLVVVLGCTAARGAMLAVEQGHVELHPHLRKDMMMMKMMKMMMTMMMMMMMMMMVLMMKMMIMT